MLRVAVIGFSLLLALPATRPTAAADVREFEEDGVRYREVTRMVRRVVPETTYEEREVKVYRRESRTEYQEYQRHVVVPVTEYHTEMRWHGIWNPFAPPYLVEHRVPVTRWETRAETVKTPVVRSELIPETRTEKVPIVTQKIVETPLVTRVAISSQRQTDPFANSGTPKGTPTVARRDRIGGVKRLESDPPRKPNYDWRPAGEGARLR